MNVMIVKAAVLEFLKVTLLFLYSPEVTISQAEGFTV